MVDKASEQQKRARAHFDSARGVPFRMPRFVNRRPGVDQANEGWAHFSTLIAGIGVYGAIGYGLDRLIGTWPILFAIGMVGRSEEHTSELQSLAYLVCRLLL